ncbi:MAG: hypothetical protein GEV08_07275 [Acidimicrobiia bacterium]|nr:hypothetical protein [Acidimicrobiia bacterium]
MTDQEANRRAGGASASGSSAGDEAVPPEYIVGHVQEALGTDAAVGEWGLQVDVDGDALTVAGIVATASRKAAVAPVARAALAALGCQHQVRDATEVAAAASPAGEEAL